MARGGLRDHVRHSRFWMVAWFLGTFWHALGRETFAGILQKRKHVSLRARDFESELSVQQMLKMHRKRNPDRVPQTESQPEATAVLTPEVLAAKPSWLQLKPAAELPCVFTPREEGVRKLGEPIELKFWQHAYVRLWQHARLHTGGAVAVRYSRGSLARSPHAFALWPSAPRERSMQGLVLGMFNLTAGSRVEPKLPLIAFFCSSMRTFLLAEMRYLGAGSPEEVEANEPVELNAFLRSLAEVWRSPRL
ncbi:unnamed protein product [Symbiodinium sp. CCMP2456]|nr:unnamed protein product [Symbiodinium sp. CCMP2456]